MLPEEKRAVFTLAVLGLSIVTVVALVPFLRAGAWGGFGLLGLGGLAGLLFRKGEQKADERDLAIAQKATLIGGMVSYLAFIVATVGPLVYFIVVGRETVPVHYLGIIVAAGAMGLMVARSVAVLVLYRRGASDAED